MSGRESRDMVAAFLIGAVFGIGATLLLRLELEDEKKALVQLLRRLRKSRRRTGAGKRFRGLLEAARDRW